MANLSTTEQLEQLQKRHRALEAERAQIQARREMAQVRVRELEDAAREQYGVTTVEELRALKARWEAENLEAVATFQTALERQETALTAIRAQASGPLV